MRIIVGTPLMRKGWNFGRVPKLQSQSNSNKLSIFTLKETVIYQLVGERRKLKLKITFDFPSQIIILVSGMD